MKPVPEDVREKLESALRDVDLARRPFSTGWSPKELSILRLLEGVEGPWSRGVLLSMRQGYAQVSWTAYARLLATLVQRGLSLEESVSKIDGIVAKKPVAALFVIPLFGPMLGRKIELTHHLCIVPTEDAGKLPGRPTCRVEHIVEIPQVFFEQGEDLQGGHPTAEVEASANTARLLLTLACSGPVGCNTPQLGFADPDAQMLAHESLGVSHGGLAQPDFILEHEVNPETLESAWSGMRKLVRNGQGRLLRACDRINRARLLRGGSPVESCIEVCIAFECLFGGKQTDSVTHKVSRRCARWLRSTIDQRAAVAGILTETYRARSAAVHGDVGALSRQTLVECGDLVSEAALKIAQSGDFPSDDHFDFAP